jgi:hypothetical protein
MKKLTLLFAVLFAASMAVAGETTEKAKSAKPAAEAKADAKAAAKSMTHEVTAEVVSTDVAKKEITIKDDKGESHTAPVEGKAIAELKTAKAGEKVIVTCRDDEKGAHKAVTSIKPAPATDKKPASAPAMEKGAAPAEKPAEIK